MDVHQFASHPSDPAWEEPHYRDIHVTTVNFHRHGNDDESTGTKEPYNPETMTERAKALDDAASELVRLCAIDAPLADVQDFLAKWQDPSSSDRIQSNALAWFADSSAVDNACRTDNRDVLRLLLAKGLHPNASAVAYANAKMRETGDSEVLKLLVDSGWNINDPINDITPSLMSMLTTEHELVQWCLSRGADPNASSQSGELLMQRAATAASLDTIKLLVDHGARVTDGGLVAHASYAHTDGWAGRLEVVQFLLDHGAPVDGCYLGNEDGKTDTCGKMLFGIQNGLHFAIWGGKKDMLELLLQRGADPNRPTRSVMKTKWELKSPIELAEMSGYPDIAELLKSAGANSNT